MSTMSADLAAAWVAAWAELTDPTKAATARVKTQKGADYSFDYTTLDRILTAARPVLGAHGLALTQQVRRDETGIRVRTLIVHASGQTHSSGWYVVTAHGGPQDHGSAITYIRRYQALALLALAPADDDDGAAAQKAATGAKQTGPKRAAQTPPDGPVTVQRATTPAAAEPAPSVAPGPSKAQLAHMGALFNAAGVKDRGERLARTAAIVGRPVQSASELTRAEAHKVIDELTGAPPPAEPPGDPDDLLEPTLPDPTDGNDPWTLGGDTP